MSSCIKVLVADLQQVPAPRCGWCWQGEEPLFSRLKEEENEIVKGWDCSYSGCWHLTKPWEQSQGSRDHHQAEPGRRGLEAGLSCPRGEGSRDIHRWTWYRTARGCSPAGDNTAPSNATQPRARPLAQLPLQCLPELLILNMLSALSVTLQFRGTPRFFMSILHEIDASSPFSNARLYESLRFFLVTFFHFYWENLISLISVFSWQLPLPHENSKASKKPQWTFPQNKKFS